MKLEINYRKKTGKFTDTRRINNMLLNNKSVKEIKELKKIMRQMKIQHIETYKMQQDKFKVINAYIKKQEKSQVNNLNFTIQGTRKRTKTKAGKRKETIEIMAKIYEI